MVLGSPIALIYYLLYALLDPQLQAATDQTEVNVDLILLASQLITATVVTLFKLYIPQFRYKRLAMLLFMLLGLGLGVLLFKGTESLSQAVFCGGVALMTIQVIFPSFLPQKLEEEYAHTMSLYAMCLDCIMTLFSGIFQSALLHKRIGLDAPSIARYRGTEYLPTIFIIYCVFASVAGLFGIGIVVSQWQNDDDDDENKDNGQFHSCK